MPNRLAQETSLYLLQHKDNPVDWFPWGEEALRRARDEDRPILVSIGYSSCHWCHVMAHESFEDPATAALMNERFICIKVDREERPDIDQIYMTALQVMGQRGGWPLNMFLLPDLTPFFGGTYFPPSDYANMPSFRRILAAVSDAFRNRREEVTANADQLRRYLVAASHSTPNPTDIETTLIAGATAQIVARSDRERGGLEGAPKFPQPMLLDLALQELASRDQPDLREVVITTLDRMAAGGMYDQIGGGFHRYSTDADWLVPHFEKMLYDNAQLLRTYLDAWLLFGDTSYREIADQTIDYLLREMHDPAGGFYAAQDADSGGHEGTFFTWTPAQLREALGQHDARIAATAWAVSDDGNFEGASILHRPRPLTEVAIELGLSKDELRGRLGVIRPKLLAARRQRVTPDTDHKIVASWNGLALNALAHAGAALDRSDALDAARANATFLLEQMIVDERLHRSWIDGQVGTPAFLEDYASVAYGLISLYEATFETRWLVAAMSLVDQAIRLFADKQSGLFFDTTADHGDLLVRPRELQDGATPSGNALLANALLRLSHLTERSHYHERANGILRAIAEPLRAAPLGFGRMLQAATTALTARREVVLAGEPTDPAFRELANIVARTFDPTRVVARADTDADLTALLPITADRGMIYGAATAYVCENRTCRLPVTTADDLHQQLTER